MPFRSKKQEMWMRINQPELYKQWVENYGHYSPKTAGKKRKKK